MKQPQFDTDDPVKSDRVTLLKNTEDNIGKTLSSHSLDSIFCFTW